MVVSLWMWWRAVWKRVSGVGREGVAELTGTEMTLAMESML
jgi:hypothetical protein